MDFKYDSTRIAQVLKTMRDYSFLSRRLICYAVYFNANILFIDQLISIKIMIYMKNRAPPKQGY